jgi:eukaryotic-like serine/threonine-protein kinase
MKDDDLQRATGVRVGDVLVGKYRVEGVLGMGGMGVVIAARHLQLDTKVALKFLLPAVLENADSVERFAREARAAVQITNEHVARVTDVGTLDNGAPFMVMEFLDGGDLAAWLRQSGPLPVDQVVDFVLQACVAVADAHRLGIVHRDLKPANLFCIRRTDGQLLVKVLDFGISKMRRPTTSGAEGSIAQTTSIVGSPLYMSPEQMQAPWSVDTRTDIWAIGVILYELLTGRPPFAGATVADVALKTASQPPPPMRGLRPEVTPELEAVIFKCLEKEAQFRYRNVAELAVALAPFARRRSRLLVERISGILETAGLSMTVTGMPTSSRPLAPCAPGGTISPVGRTDSGTSGGNGKAVIIVVAGVLGLLALGSFAGYRMIQKEPTPPLASAAARSLSNAPSAPIALPPAPVPATAAVALPPAPVPATPAAALPPAPTSTAPMAVVAPAATVVLPAGPRPRPHAPAPVVSIAPAATPASPSSTSSRPPPATTATDDPLSKLQVK